MNPDTTLAIATAPKRNSKTWTRGTTTWGEVLGWLAEPADHKEAGDYLLGTLSGTRRGRHTVLSRSALTLDADTPKRELPELVEMLFDAASAVHTTYSSTPDAPRYRLIFPLSREVTPEEYTALAEVVMARLGAAQFDPGSVEPSRYMFKPAAKERSWYQSWSFDGPAMDVDELLQHWDRDLSSRPTPRGPKRSPFELEGAVGAFNRAYEDFAELVAAYDLPYEPSGERWHLVGAKAEAGMGEIGNGLVYSHHITDPAYGQACSAFDLVRLHRFLDLDEDVEEGTPVNRLPSHEAMLELASRDHRVTAQMVGVDFDGILDAIADDPDGDHGDDPEDDSWKLGLNINPRTGKLRDEIGNWDLIVANDPVFRGLLFNELTMTVESEVDLPWRPLARGGEVFGSADRAALAHHLERTYDIKVNRTLLDELINVCARHRYENPIRDYLLGLRWDGELRLEECLPGVHPTPYTRLVARKCMTAAAARILEPGIKWDHTLVLFGEEGLGKSHWIEKVSRGYMSTLGRIDNKDTLLTMQRSWIMVADEGYSLRKGDADAMKEFLTRTEDVYRMPYDREALVHPRHCVIWSSTNDEVFLRRQEGNRRFLIVHAEDKVDFTLLTDEYIDQLWAEAMHYYREGEQLFLSDDEARLAKEQRERFTEEDVLAGLLQEHLDHPVPEGWDRMTAEQRRTWRSAEADGMASGSSQIQRVCSAELWVDVLGGKWGQQKRGELLEISTVLKRLPGWHQLPGRHRVHGYGPQVVFERSSEGDDPFDIL